MQKEKKSRSAIQKDAVAKGHAGEITVQTVLSQLYPSALVDKASIHHKSGDLIFKQGSLKCMVEIKNKNLIRNLDFAKFYRDIISLCQHKLINAALYISLAQPYMYVKTPRRSNPFYAEVLCGIPVLYVYAPDADPAKIKLAIEFLLHNNLQKNNIPLPYLTPAATYAKTCRHFMADPPPDLDALDLAAFTRIKSAISQVRLPAATSLEIERAKYMIMEHLLPKSKRLITSAMCPTHVPTKQQLLHLHILSADSISLMETLSAFDELFHYLITNQLFPDEIK